jgi:hypothetical protein
VGFCRADVEFSAPGIVWISPDHFAGAEAPRYVRQLSRTNRAIPPILPYTSRHERPETTMRCSALAPWICACWVWSACAGPSRAPTGTHLRATAAPVCAPTFATGIHGAFRGGLELSWPEWGGFGGWSDLRVQDAGNSLLAVSDDGHYLQAALTHMDGQLAQVHDTQTGALPHCPDKRRCDVESMAERADGSLWLGLERSLGTGNQIWAFPASQPPFAREPQAITLPPGAPELPLNAGLEAMTTLADDSVLAIAEGQEPLPATLPMWRWQGAAWQTLDYPATADFRPVALAALPQGHALGDALVLERKWLAQTREAGSRIVALRLLPNGQVATLEVVRLEPSRCLLDNFEGLATRELDGVVWLYLLSDDNQSARQKTLLYALTLE